MRNCTYGIKGSRNQYRPNLGTADHCVFANNTTAFDVHGYGGAWNNWNWIKNSIFYNNTNGISFPYLGSVTVSYTNFYGNTTNMMDMLCPETYNILVTDANGCIFQTSYEVGSSYDSSLTFVDTLDILIDTCIFNNTLPVDSALIYN